MKLKRIVLDLPEYLLIAAVLFYWSSTALILNPIAIVLMGILIFQLIFKNKIIGIMIPFLLILICLFMLLALLSEFNELPTFNDEAKQLLFVGLSYFISTIIISVVMLYKYFTLATKKNDQKMYEHQ